MAEEVVGPFTDSFSRQSGDVWIITLDDTATQLSHLAQSLNKADIVADLAPPTINGDTEHPAPKPLTADGKRDVLQRISAAVEGGALKDAKEFDLVGFCNLFSYLVYEAFPAIEDHEALLLNLASAITTAGPHLGFARYQALVTLYNSVPPRTDTTLPCALLIALLRLAASEPTASTLEIMRPTLHALPALLVSWATPEPQAEAAVTDALVVADRDPAAAYALLKAYVSSADAASVSNELRKVHLALALRLPRIFDFPASTLTDGTAESDLAVAILAGRADAVQAYPTVPERVGGRDALVTKARSVAIARALADHVGRIVTYDDAKTALASTSPVSSESDAQGDLELEGWIIDAIKSGLVSARLNQPRRQISVLRSVPPTSEVAPSTASGTAEEWQRIQGRLVTWKSALDRMLETVRVAAGLQTESTAPTATTTEAAAPADGTPRASIAIEAS